MSRVQRVVNGIGVAIGIYVGGVFVVGVVVWLVSGPSLSSKVLTGRRDAVGREIVLRDTKCECGSELSPQYGGGEYWRVHCPDCGRLSTWGVAPGGREVKGRVQATTGSAASTGPLRSAPEAEDPRSGRLKAREAEVAGRERAVQIAQNEVAALAHMKSLISAQAQAQQGASYDADHDGVGEYVGAFKNGSSVAQQAGYHFQLYLPDARGAGVSGKPGLVHADPNFSETTWCCYGWPVEYGATGRHAFFTNQAGDVTRCDSPAYTGASGGPRADAAFQDAGLITGGAAIAVPAVDGNTWKAVG